MSSTAPPAGQCTSGPNRTCQFAELLAAREYEGRYYCQAHAPLGAPGRFTVTELHEFIAHQAPKIGPARNLNLAGVVFAAEIMKRLHITSENVDAQGCTFASGTKLNVQGNLTMSGSKCIGIFHLDDVRELRAQNVQFEGNVSIACTNSRYVDLAGSTFRRQLRLANVSSHTNELHLDDAILARAPDIVSNKELPQNSSFQRLKLLKSAYGRGAESKYRSIRNALHDNRDREQEGLFYEYEKRAKRRGLSLRRYQSWVPREVSICYDWLAGYGQSYERALLWFLAAQVCFALVYSIMSDRFGWGGELDSQVIAFTFAQIVKPFELLSARTADGWP